MRLTLEAGHLTTKINAGDPPPFFLLSGTDRAMESAGHSLRSKCVEWFRRRLDSPVPQLGQYVQNGRLYVRGDLPALEMVKKGKDVPEEGDGRKAAIMNYLEDMSKSFTWGSSPEYTAVAIMTGKQVNVWQYEDKHVIIIDRVSGTLLPPEDENNVEEEDENDGQHEVHNGNGIDIDEDSGTIEPISDAIPSAFAKAAEDDAMLYDGESLPDLPASPISDEADEAEDVEDDSSEYDGSYNLLFVGGCHYEALITRKQYLMLVATYGIEAVENILPLNEINEM